MERRKMQRTDEVVLYFRVGELTLKNYERINFLTTDRKQDNNEKWLD